MKMKMKRADLISRLKAKLAERTKLLAGHANEQKKNNEMAQKKLVLWLAEALMDARNGQYTKANSRPGNSYPMSPGHYNEKSLEERVHDDCVCRRLKANIEMLELAADDVLEFTSKQIDEILM